MRLVSYLSRSDGSWARRAHGIAGPDGPRYQIAAALLTYFAVSMSSIPVVIAYIVKAGDTDPNGRQRPG
jgi:hypothetical protein